MSFINWLYRMRERICELFKNIIRVKGKIKTFYSL